MGDISYRFERVQGPTIVMAVKPYEPLPRRRPYREGIAVILSSVRRNHPQALDPAIKSCNLLNNILAVREAQARGALEPIMLNQRGEVAEGASSNVFIVQGRHAAHAAAERRHPARRHPRGGAGAGSRRAGIPAEERVLHPPDLSGRTRPSSPAR